MTFTIPGEPVGKGRPRVDRGRAHTPENTKAYEEKVKWLYRAAHGRLLEGPIRMTVIALYYIPKSASKKTRRLMLDGALLPTKKPDLDNVVKCIMDSLNKLAYKDDAQIVTLVAEKCYGAEPMVLVRLSEIKEARC